MGLRFRRRVRLEKGIWMNVSKSGTSLSVGGHGETVNFSKKGATTTVGIPGTGISYRSGPSGQHHVADAPGVPNSYSVGGLFKFFGWFVVVLFAAAVIIGLITAQLHTGR